MGRARNPARDEAFKMWAESDGKCNLKEIAVSLNLPDNRIRKWKSEDKWEERIKEQDKKERSEKTLRKKGAPKGNKNAVGAGAKPGNQNSTKSGVYASLDLIMQGNVLADDEREYFERDGSMDVEAELVKLIKAYTIREYRIMKEIDAYRGAEKPEPTQQITTAEKRKFADKKEEALYNKKIQEKVKSGKRLPGESFSSTIMAEPKSKRIERLEDQLTKVQRAKKEALALLHSIMMDKTGSTKNAVADDWIAAIRGVKHDDK